MAIKVYSPTDFEDTSSGVSIDGNLVVDTSVLYVDTANDRVGIGTTNPTTKLYLKGFGTGGGEIKIDSSASNASFGIFRFQGDSSTYDKYLIAYNSAHGTQANELSLKNTAGNITFYAGTGGTTAERMRIDSSGNVGIGTTSPDFKLDVAGDIGINDKIYHNGDHNTYISLTDDAQTFRTGGTDRVTIDNTRVTMSSPLRIDTTGTALEITGTTTVDSSDVSIYLGNSPGAYGFYITYAGSGGGNTNAFRIRSTNAGNPKTLLTSNQDGIVNFPNGLELNGAGVATQSWVGSQSYATQTYVNTAVSNLVDSAPSTLDTLNELAAALGDDPNFATTVTNSIAAKLSLAGGTLTGSLAGTNITATNFYGQNLYVTSSGNTVANRIDNDGSGLYFTYGGASNKGIYLKDSNGNVGIGTTSPSEKLDVIGNIELTQHLKATGNNLSFSAGGNQIMNIDLNGKVYPSTDSAYDLGFSSTMAWRNLYVDNVLANGNVGIDTTIPQKKLDVNGSGIVASIGGAFSAGSFAGFHFGYSETTYGNDLYKKSALVFERTDNHSQGGNASGKIHFLLNNISNGSATSLSDSVVTIDTDAVATQGSARVGIGTTSPQGTLEVEAASTINGTELAISNDYGESEKFITFRNGSDIIGQISTYGRHSTSGAGPAMTFDLSNGTSAVERLRITKDGNVGIGTSGPTSYGSSARTLEVRGNTGTGSGLIRVSNADNSVGASLYSSSSAGTLNVQTNHPLTFATNNSEKMRITSAGNVGIGTTNPTAKLRIAAPVDDGILLESNNALLGNTGTGYSQLIYWNGSAMFYGRNTTGVPGGSGGVVDDHLFRTNGATRMQITSSGNVGIGTTSPSRKLHVVGGDVYVPTTSDTAGTGSYGGNSFELRNSATGEHFNVDVFNRTTSTWYTPFHIQNTGNVGIGTTSPGFKLHVDKNATGYIARIQGDTNNISFYDGGSSGIGIGTDANQDLKLYVNDSLNSGIVIKSTGKVGIGTTSPEARLHIAGDHLLLSNGIELRSKDTGGSVRTIARVNGSTNDLEYGWSGAGAVKFMGGGSYTERMRIHTNGNVGIGTTSPQALLQVGSVTSSFYNITTGNADIIALNKDITDTQMGTLNVTSTSRRSSSPFNQGYGPSITFTQNGSGYVDGYEKVIGGIKTEIRDATNLDFASVMQFYTHNNSALAPKMTIGSSGNVGIGTTSPSYKLDIKGASANIGDGDQIFSVGNTTGGTQLAFGSSENSYNWIRSYESGAGGRDFVLAANAEIMRLTAAGTVGIGTSSPGAKLQINGATADGTASALIVRNSSLTSLFSVRNDGRVDIAAGALVQSGGGYANTSSNSSYFTGNVGIGTSSPAQKLEVVGTIQATSTGTATLILRGDSNNSDDTGQLDSTIKMLHDDGNHGILLETRNYVSAQSFEIKSLSAGTETSRFLIDTDGTLKIPAYGAGFLTTDANGAVSVDATSYVDATGDTMTGDLTIQRGLGDLTFLTLKQENTSSDLVAQKSFIDFTFVDSNSNETPQVRIGAEVGNNDGSASSQAEEGMGAFVVYTNNADTDAGAAGTSLAERFRVDRLGNVGIGTTSPAQKLEVSFAASVYGARFTRNDANGSSLIEFANSTGVKNITGYDAGYDGYKIGTTTATNLIVKPNSNVGINTTSPSYKLDVSGTVRVAQTLHLNGQASGYSTGFNGSTIYSAASTFASEADMYGALVLQSRSDGVNRPILFVNGATPSEKMRITPGGYIGIGTTAPNNELEILGSNSPRISLRTSSETVGEALELGFQVGTGLNASSNTVGLIKSVITQANPSSLIGDLEFQTNTGDSASTKMIIKGNGNVGIGTTSPAYKLDVAGDIYISNGESLYLGNANSRISSNSSSDILYFPNRDHVFGSVISGADIERVRITEAGNVGIGTTSPSSKLEIRSESADHRLVSINRPASDTAALYLGNDSATPANAVISSNYSDLILGRDQSGVLTEHLRIKRDGNVGIGTTSPSEKLHVSGNVRIEGDLTVNGSYTQIDTDVNTTEQWNVTNDGTGPAVTINQTGAQDIMDVQDDGTSVFYIEDGGNVGIGTTAPDHALHVKSAATGDASNIKIESTSQYGGLAFYENTANRGTLAFGDNNNIFTGALTNSLSLRSEAALHLGAGGNNLAITIATDGNVGIGTATPAAKLSVSGAILAGGKYSYRKGYGSLDTTGAAVAGLSSASNGASAMFKFEMNGGLGHYQKVVYSCYNAGGNWFANKVIDEGTNELDVEASANNNTTITFTFKARNSTQSYSPAVEIEASGAAINTTYL